MRADIPARCVICNGDQFAYIFRKNNTDFVKCTKCTWARVYPFPSAEELRDCYDREFTLPSGMGTALVLQREMARATARTRLETVVRYVPGPRLLDVGCADGLFVEEAANAGFDAEGIDMSKSAIERAQNKGLRLFCGTLDTIGSDRVYDVITGFDIIEHVLDPVSFLKSVYDLLRPGGLLILTTPDTRSIFCRLMGRRWSLYIPVIHLSYFSRRNIGLLLIHCGLSPLSIRKAYKYLNYDYSIIQFKAYNPLIYGAFSMLKFALPESWRQHSLPFYIGEMMVVARKEPARNKL